MKHATRLGFVEQPMPFTPFHFGPALTLKALFGERFSLTVFGVTQVAMDVEPLVRILRGDRILHGFTHTFAGATLIGAGCAVLCGLCVPPALTVWNQLCDSPQLRGFQVRGRLTWSAVIATAFVGTWSHVLLDGLMHADLRPFAPWTDWNPLLGLVSRMALHAGCLLAGMLGLLGIAWNASAPDS